MNMKRQAVQGNFEAVRRLVPAFAQEDDGVTAIEYALLAASIVVIAAGSIAVLGDRVEAMWTWISTQVSAAV